MATGMQDRLAAVGDTLKGLDDTAVADLRSSLKEKTGVDFGSYVNKEMMETLGELLLFPKYALKTVLRPPAVVGDTLYLKGNNNLYCIEAS